MPSFSFSAPSFSFDAPSVSLEQSPEAGTQARAAPRRGAACTRGDGHFDLPEASSVVHTKRLINAAQTISAPTQALTVAALEVVAVLLALGVASALI